MYYLDSKRRILNLLPQYTTKTKRQCQDYDGCLKDGCRVRNNMAIRLNNNNIPVIWCNCAIHSNVPQWLGTIPVLVNREKIPRITCTNTRINGQRRALLKNTLVEGTRKSFRE